MAREGAAVPLSKARNFGIFPWPCQREIDKPQETIKHISHKMTHKLREDKLNRLRVLPDERCCDPSLAIPLATKSRIKSRR